MSDRDFHALVAQALDVGALRLVGALHRIAEVQHHLGDAAHADAADADEMHRPNVARQFHDRSSISYPLPLVGRGRGGGREVSAGVDTCELPFRPPPYPPPNKLALGRAQARPGWGEGKITGL